MRKLNLLTRKYYFVTLFNIKIYEFVKKKIFDMRFSIDMYFRAQKK